MKILIIDDDEELIDVLEDLLKTDHEVTCFNDPLKAWEHYQENQDFNVVITDFMMPKLRGDALIAKIFELTPNQSFIVISGFFTKQFTDILKISNAYIQMIKKPLDLFELEKALDSISKIR
ncbi:MAG: hypothetical protein COA79_08220 [Planctomycetota bacterium]|nr:MAG: hypothetical protein COA79_08220 [Planctomycetota bacterium]